MPDTRERLIELIGRTPCCGFSSVAAVENIADHLIANGVTVQQWIPVTERLPEPGERVLVCIGAVFEAFIDDGGKWQRYYSAPLNEVLGEPTHWMPLPAPPEG